MDMLEFSEDFELARYIREQMRIERLNYRDRMMAKRAAVERTRRLEEAGPEAQKIGSLARLLLDC